MNVTLMQNNFTSGEISPMMDGRIDSGRYQTGLSLCENFLPTRQGGLKRRPGSRYAGNTKSNAVARLANYQAIGGDYYELEFTNLKLRIWKQDKTLVQSGGSPAEVTTPYTTAQLFGIKLAVVKGVVYLVHPSHPPATITLSGGTFAYNVIIFVVGSHRTFAATNKYPSVISFNGGRLYLGGTNEEPNAIFASKPPIAATGVDQFNDFTFGTAADDAIYLQETDMYGTHLHWLVHQKRLISGTDRTIWMDSGALATPASFDMSLVSFTGASPIQAKVAENLVVYAGRENTTMHAMIFSEESGGYVDVDLTRDADHILAAGIKDFSIMTFPESIIWVVRNDGVLCSCTLDQKNGIVAWARHPMGEGAVVECVSIGVCTEADDVWLVVLRGSVRTVEYIRFCELFTSTIDEAFFVDNGITITNSPADPVVSGIAHLNGYDVDALGDGAVLPQKTVAAGEVTYDRAVGTVNIGIPITSMVRTLRPELPANGTSQGKKKRIEKQTLRFYASLGGKVGVSLSNMVPILDLYPGTYVLGSVLQPVTGDKDLDISGGNTSDGRLYIVQDAPVPFNLLAAMTRFAIMET